VGVKSSLFYEFIESSLVSHPKRPEHETVCGALPPCPVYIIILQNSLIYHAVTEIFRSCSQAGQDRGYFTEFAHKTISEHSVYTASMYFSHT
jgi:hypothetical protein